ncbi:MAG: thiamine-phosphate kinase [Streptosporangiales bacterium]|nr:thiamine-phosphate kinase [Streptosporangiales bacterium]
MERRFVITIAELGEFGLIARMTAGLPQGPAVLLGPGDDAAVVRVDGGRVVATIDVLVEGRHFRREWSTPYDVGRKSAAQSLADVAAMGAHPTALLVGFAAPTDLPVAWADGFVDGLRDECGTVGASVIGGDVVRADAITLAITALGEPSEAGAVTRGGARSGDVVAVAGTLGRAAAGLELLRHSVRSAAEELVSAHRRPEPPYASGPAAARLGATAMIDVSDGLVADLGHVATASGVRIEVDAAALPLPDAVRDAADTLEVDPLSWVLTGGEDHALAATFPADVALPAEWTVIGRVVSGAGVVVDGRAYDLGGWEHFRG